MHSAFTTILHRLLVGPRTTLRFAIANAMFVILVVKELVVRMADE